MNYRKSILERGSWEGLLPTLGLVLEMILRKQGPVQVDVVLSKRSSVIGSMQNSYVAGGMTKGRSLVKEQPSLMLEDGNSKSFCVCRVTSSLPCSKHGRRRDLSSICIFCECYVHLATSMSWLFKGHFFHFPICAY